VAAGGENALARWRELQGMGYPGTAKQVHRWLAERRTRPVKTAAAKWCSAEPMPARQSGVPSALPPPKQLAWRIVRSPAALDREQAGVIARIWPSDREGVQNGHPV
jgi:hypothetical protein